MIFIDVLDLCSFFVVLTHLGRKNIVYYLSSPDGFSGTITIWLLKFFGYRVYALTSYFAERPFKEYYLEFHSEILCLVHGEIYRILNEQVLEELKGFNGWARERIVRSLVLKSWGIVHRAFELIKTVKYKEIDSNCLILVQHSEFFSVLQEYSCELKDCLKYYKSPFRLQPPRRRDFFLDHIDESPSLFSTLYSALKGSILLCLSVCFSMVFYIKQIINRSKYDGESFNHDIIVFTAKSYDPTPMFNDVYWARHLRDQQMVSTIIVDNMVLSEAAKEYYGRLSDRMVSLKFPFIGPLDRDLVWPAIARQYLRFLIESIGICIRHLLMRRLSGYYVAYLLRLLPLVCFYKSLLLATAARIVWCSEEGHNLDAQALAIAAASVDAVSLGSTWSLRYVPVIFASMNRNDILFVWGKRQIDNLRYSDALVRRYVECGYPTIRFCLNDPKRADETSLASKLGSKIGGQKKIVTFYDNVCGMDTIICCNELRLMYDAILDWIESNNEVLLIMKTKRDEYRKLGKEMHDRIEKLKRKGAVLVRSEHGDLKVGLISDAVISISSSSLGCVAAAYGTPTVLYDWHGVMATDNWPLYLENVFMIKNVSDISGALEKALNFDRYEKPLNGGSVDAFLDSGGDERTALYIGFLHKALSEGKTAVSAMEHADKKYRCNLGHDRIHIVR